MNPEYCAECGGAIEYDRDDRCVYCGRKPARITINRIAPNVTQQTPRASAANITAGHPCYEILSVAYPDIGPRYYVALARPDDQDVVVTDAPDWATIVYEFERITAAAAQAIIAR